MGKILRFFSVTIIVLTGLSFFGWMVKHRTIKDKDFGIANRPVEEIAGFFDLFKKSVEEVKSLPATFVSTPNNFEYINELEDDIMAVISYSNEQKNRNIDLINLKDDSVHYRWEVELKKPFQAHDRIFEPILFPDKSICYSFNGGSGLCKIDSLGNEVWRQDSIVHHHSLNFDIENNIYACAQLRDPNQHFNYKGIYRSNYYDVHFIDDAFVLIDGISGVIKYKKSILEILVENNLEHLLLRAGNSEDPMHINDVQPALTSTEHYQLGDVFLSFRNLYCIMHFRPSTNELIELIEGPFACQHDVDFYSPNVISIFNNNTHFRLGSHEQTLRTDSNARHIGEIWSEILLYDLVNKEYRSFNEEIFSENEIFTFTEGLIEFIDEETVFIEEQNSGVLWVFKNDQVIYKNVLNSHHENHHHLPNWTRIIKDK